MGTARGNRIVAAGVATLIAVVAGGGYLASTFPSYSGGDVCDRADVPLVRIAGTGDVNGVGRP